MKARVIATGEIIDETAMVSTLGDDFYLRELEPISEDMESIDYWTRLEHQAAIAAMQGMIADPVLIDVYSADGKLSFQPFVEATVDICYDFAHALVEKMKEER